MLLTVWLTCLAAPARSPAAARLRCCVAAYADRASLFLPAAPPSCATCRYHSPHLRILHPTHRISTYCCLRAPAACCAKTPPDSLRPAVPTISAAVFLENRVLSIQDNVAALSRGDSLLLCSAFVNRRDWRLWDDRRVVDIAWDVSANNL